jgi:uncharacterized membrane protein
MRTDAAELNQYSSAALDQDRRGARSHNMSETERWVSLGVGVGLLALGLKQGIRDGLMLAITGGALLYRGATGQCPLYKVAGIDTSSDRPRPGVSVPHGRGVKVENTVLINKSPEVLYSYWRQFENLPKFMENLVSVKTEGDQRSHWVVKAIGNAEISWDAEIVNDVPNELIAWRTVENSDVDHAGSVRFEGNERQTVDGIRRSLVRARTVTGWERRSQHIDALRRRRSALSHSDVAIHNLDYICGLLVSNAYRLTSSRRLSA